MIYQQKPEDFDPRFEVAGTFLENNDKILLLHRQDHKPQGGTWGMPAGKIDEGEELKEGMIRELREETGIILSKNEIDHKKKLFVKYPNYDFIYHIFRAESNNGNIKIREEEHKDFEWVKPGDALNMNLIGNLKECIKLFYDLE